jgi:hypothetical protein
MSLRSLLKEWSPHVLVLTIHAKSSKEPRKRSGNQPLKGLADLVSVVFIVDFLLHVMPLEMFMKILLVS